ncbi:hypothetical protein MEQU1_002778 [Malassezia equina]|uniref:Uncharacterized protein n=1 Tax=Malassezia equina TaxID=1381935 RepID=A0AAF0IZM5_9BASI|nr:hypothetical protein MEQU1_002778 [Malassezia equina]
MTPRSTGTKERRFPSSLSMSKPPSQQSKPTTATAPRSASTTSMPPPSSTQVPRRRRFKDTRELDVLRSEVSYYSRRTGMSTPYSASRPMSPSIDSLSPHGFASIPQSPSGLGSPVNASQTSLLNRATGWPGTASPMSQIYGASSTALNESPISRVQVPEGMGVGVTDSPYPVFAKPIENDAFAMGNSLRAPSRANNQDMLRDAGVYGPAASPSPMHSMADLQQSLHPEPRSLMQSWQNVDSANTPPGAPSTPQRTLSPPPVVGSSIPPSPSMPSKAEQGRTSALASTPQRASVASAPSQVRPAPTNARAKSPLQQEVPVSTRPPPTTPSKGRGLFGWRRTSSMPKSSPGSQPSKAPSMPSQPAASSGPAPTPTPPPAAPSTPGHGAPLRPSVARSTPAGSASPDVNHKQPAEEIKRKQGLFHFFKKTDKSARASPAPRSRGPSSHAPPTAAASSALRATSAPGVAAPASQAPVPSQAAPAPPKPAAPEPPKPAAPEPPKPAAPEPPKPAAPEPLKPAAPEPLKPAGPAPPKPNAAPASARMQPRSGEPAPAAPFFSSPALETRGFSSSVPSPRPPAASAVPTQPSLSPRTAVSPTTASVSQGARVSTGMLYPSTAHTPVPSMATTERAQAPPEAPLPSWRETSEAYTPSSVPSPPLVQAPATAPTIRPITTSTTSPAPTVTTPPISDSLSSWVSMSMQSPTDAYPLTQDMAPPTTFTFPRTPKRAPPPSSQEISADVSSLPVYLSPRATMEATMPSAPTRDGRAPVSDAAPSMHGAEANAPLYFDVDDSVASVHMNGEVLSGEDSTIHETGGVLRLSRSMQDMLRVSLMNPSLLGTDVDTDTIRRVKS